MPIHPTALIDPRATIHPDAEIGAFVVVDGPVAVGPGTRVLSHAVLTGRTTIGQDNVIHMGAVIGHEPQYIAFTGEETELRIGDRNVFREHSEVHRGSKPESATVIGNDNYIMTQVHVAHDCQLGDHVIIGGGTMIAGHVEVADQVFVSGNCVVHQFVRIGRLALLRGLSRTSRDVPPFCVMDGTHTVRGLNRIGLRRADFGAQQISDLQRAFVRLFRGRKNLERALVELESETSSADVHHLIEFIRASQRGVCVGLRQAARPEEEE